MHVRGFNLRGQGLAMPQGGGALSDPRGWPWLALAGAWAAFVALLLAGRVTAPLPLFGLLAAVPAGFLLVRFLRGERSPDALSLAAGIASLASVCVIVGHVAQQGLIAAAALPAVMAMTLLCRRFPAAVVGTAFFFTAASSSIEVFTGIRVGKITDVILIGLWLSVIIGFVLTRRDRPALLWPGVIAAGAFVFITLAQALTSSNLTLALTSFRSSAWLMATVLLIAYAGWPRSTYRWIGRGIVLVAALIGAYATLRYVIGPDPKERAQALSDPSLADYNTINGRYLRLIGSFPTPHALATWTAMMIPFCAAFALVFKGRWRLIAVLACVGCTVADFGSQARVGLVALVAGLAAVLALYQLARAVPGLHLGKSLATALVAVTAGVVVFTLVVANSHEQANRYAGILHPTRDASFEERVRKWNNAFVDIRNHPFGQGLGTAGAVGLRQSRFYNTAFSNLENGYLVIAYQQGIPVVVLYVLVLLLLIWGLARHSLATLDREKAAYGIGAVGTLVAFSVMLMNGQYGEDIGVLAPWIVVGLAIAGFAYLDPPGRATDPQET